MGRLPDVDRHGGLDRVRRGVMLGLGVALLGILVASFVFDRPTTAPDPVAEPPAETGRVIVGRPIEGLELAPNPSIDIDPGPPEKTVTIVQPLVWNFRPERGQSFWCRVALHDSEGTIIRESVEGPNGALFPAQNFRGRPPYESDVVFAIFMKPDSPDPVSAEVDCSFRTSRV